MLRLLALRHLVYCHICIFPKQFEKRGSIHDFYKPSRPDRFIDKKGLKAFVPYSSSHIARLEKNGDFPRRVQLGPGRVAWSENDIGEWIELKKQANRGG